MPENVKRKLCLCSDCCCFAKKKKGERATEKEEEKTQMSTHKKMIDGNKGIEPVYQQEFKEPLKPGACIVIRGTVRSQCKRFAVNLLYERGTKTDVAFHFNPRLAMRYIVRNSRINNCWGEEETTSVEKFHLDRNRIFELHIVASEREFLIALDGRHLCAYVYRIPLEKINKLQADGIDVRGVEVLRRIKSYPSVEGALDITEVTHKDVEAYPMTEADTVQISVPMGNGSDGDKLESQQLIVPITANLPKGFREGWQLEINGRVKILPSAFYVNLQQGNNLWPHPVIPLHLNPRFYTSFGNHLFVRNSWIDGQWGTEERTPGFQFTPGKKFQLAIRRNSDNFAVWVDGTLAGEFQFRTPVNEIDTVYIHGDVQISGIYLKDHIDDKYFNKSREKINSL